MDGVSYNKQSILQKYDEEPTQGSKNLVTSGSVKQYVDENDGVLNGRIDTLNTQIGAAFYFKGSTTYTALLALPESGLTINDTYYVTDAGKMCWYTWNGNYGEADHGWHQSSMNQAAYDGIIADLRNQLAAEYSNQSTYNVGEFVINPNDDKVYCCKTAITVAESWTAAHWEELPTFADAFENVILVTDTQPTTATNKIWVPETVTESEVPTMTDLENIIADEYSASITYAVGDYCIHTDATTHVSRLYKCKTAITVNEEWTPSHWTAVNTTDEITNVNNALNMNLIEWQYDRFYIDNSSGTVNLTPVSSVNWECSVIDCAPGDEFTINAYAGTNQRAWAFIDSSNAVIISSYVQVAWVHEIITAPAGASKLVINNRRSTQLNPPCYYGANTPTQASINYNKISDYLLSNFPHKPFAYTNVGYLYNGSVNRTDDTMAEPGYEFSGFNRVSSGDTSTYAVTKQLADYCKFQQLSVGQTFKISVWAELTDGVTSLEVRYIRFTTRAGWGSGIGIAAASNITLVPGWNDITLTSTVVDSAYSVYGYFAVQCATLSNIQSIKTLYVYNGIAALTAKRLEGFSPSDYYTKAQVDTMIESVTPAYDYDLVCWGDSLTAGSGGGGTAYPTVCAAELGITSVLNNGVGGETANTIAARQGGNNLIIPAGAVNGTIAYTDMNDIFGGVINPLRQGSPEHGGNKLYIDGEECSLTLSQTSSVSTDAVYTISSYTGGTTVFPRLGRFIGSNINGKIVTIFVGQNGSKVGDDTTVTARIKIIDSMLAHIGHDRVVILGLSSGNDSSRNADDEAMFAHYGQRFFPTRRNLVNYGMAINGLTPTVQDETDIAAGKVPESLRKPDDNIHLNAYGYTAVGKMLADKIRSLGYV